MPPRRDFGISGRVILQRCRAYGANWLKEPNTKDRKFEDVVKDAEQAAVLVLVY